MRFGLISDLPPARNAGETKRVVLKMKQLRTAFRKKGQEIDGIIFLGNINDISGANSLMELEKEYDSRFHFRLGGEDDRNTAQRALEEAKRLQTEVERFNRRIQQIKGKKHPDSSDQQLIQEEEIQLKRANARLNLIKGSLPYLSVLLKSKTAGSMAFQTGRYRGLLLRSDQLFQKFAPQHKNNFMKILYSKEKTKQIWDLMEQMQCNIMMVGCDTKPYFCKISETGYDMATIEAKGSSKEDVMLKQVLLEEDKKNVIVPGSVMQGFFAILDTQEGASVAMPRCSFYKMIEREESGEDMI